MLGLKLKLPLRCPPICLSEFNHSVDSAASYGLWYANSTPETSGPAAGLRAMHRDELTDKTPPREFVKAQHEMFRINLALGQTRLIWQFTLILIRPIFLNLSALFLKVSCVCFFIFFCPPFNAWIMHNSNVCVMMALHLSNKLTCHETVKCRVCIPSKYSFYSIGTSRFPCYKIWYRQTNGI